jgi:hypothetical protein
MGKCAFRGKTTIADRILNFNLPMFMLTLVFLGIKIAVKNESLDQRIVDQEEKIRQLKARKTVILARARSVKKAQERKNDTRRKILLGAYLLNKMESDAVFSLLTNAELSVFLTENRDRELFGLQPLTSSPT